MMGYSSDKPSRYNGDSLAFCNAGQLKWRARYQVGHLSLVRPDTSNTQFVISLDL